MDADAAGMTTLTLRRKDSPLPLELGDEALVAKSAAVLEAAGCRLIQLAHAIGPWAILATCPWGLTAWCVVREHRPELLGPVWSLPEGWPVSTRRMVHVWKADAPLPEALTL